MEFGFPENMTVDSKVGTCFMRYPENPMGGTVTFCSKLGIYNDRSVGTFNYKGRVQPGFYSKICMDRNQENCNSPQRSRYFYGRSSL